MNEIQIFNNNNFGKLRVIVKDGKVWFCLADACKALEIRNLRNVKKRLDSRGVHTMDVSTNSKNRHGEFTRITTMTYIDAANLLSLHLPELLRFKNPRDVKKRLDSGCVDTIDTPTT